LVRKIALALQGALLVQHAPLFVADAFCAARLTDAGGLSYGALSTKADVDAILARAMPA
jgi:putative acyl-CoA dehydrogenase